MSAVSAERNTCKWCATGGLLGERRRGPAAERRARVRRPAARAARLERHSARRRARCASAESPNSTIVTIGQLQVAASGSRTTRYKGTGPAPTQEDPFVMPRQSAGLVAGGGADALRSHEPYEGFCIDLLELLARALHFNYTMHYVLAVRTSSTTRHSTFAHMKKLCTCVDYLCACSTASSTTPRRAGMASWATSSTVYACKQHCE